MVEALEIIDRILDMVIVGASAVGSFLGAFLSIRTLSTDPKTWKMAFYVLATLTLAFMGSSVLGYMTARPACLTILPMIVAAFLWRREEA